jgi:hypothetical protein
MLNVNKATMILASASDDYELLNLWLASRKFRQYDKQTQQLKDGTHITTFYQSFDLTKVYDVTPCHYNGQLYVDVQITEYIPSFSNFGNTSSISVKYGITAQAHGSVSDWVDFSFYAVELADAAIQSDAYVMKLMAAWAAINPPSETHPDKE